MAGSTSIVNVSTPSGQYCLEVQLDAGAESQRYRRLVKSGTPTSFIHEHFKLVSGLSSGRSFRTCTLIDNTNAVVAGFRITNNGGTYEIDFEYYDGAVWQTGLFSSPIAFSLDTWVRLQYKYDKVNDAWEVYVDTARGGYGTLPEGAPAPVALGVGQQDSDQSSGTIITRHDEEVWRVDHYHLRTYAPASADWQGEFSTIADITSAQQIAAQADWQGEFSTTGILTTAVGTVHGAAADWQGEFNTAADLSFFGPLFVQASWTGQFASEAILYASSNEAITATTVIPDEVIDVTMSFTSIESLTTSYKGRYKMHWNKSGEEALQEAIGRSYSSGVGTYGTSEEVISLPWIKDRGMASEVLGFWAEFNGQERMVLEANFQWRAIDYEMGDYLNLQTTGVGNESLALLVPYQTGGLYNFMVTEKTYNWAQEERTLTLVKIT